MPFLVDLKSYAALRAQQRCATFFEYFDVLAKEEHCPVDGKVINRYLAAGNPAVLMFDGLDEIFEPAEQEAITMQVIAIAESWANARIVVTSREHVEREVFRLLKLHANRVGAKELEECAVDEAVHVRAVEREDEVALSELLDHRAGDFLSAVGRLPVAIEEIRLEDLAQLVSVTAARC